ncbi:MAG: HEPN domain-containing protein [Candidatus Methanoperedens sp.]|nr:HEPN domain-containing protein [Candidatus Methanoperedens sp.]
MTTNREQGEKLLKEAEWIFEKDLKNAMEEGNYNIAVRRAQEIVELSLKGCLRISEDTKKAFEDATFVLKEIKPR